MRREFVLQTEFLADQINNHKTAGCCLLWWKIPGDAWSTPPMWPTMHPLPWHVLNRFVIHRRRNARFHARRLAKLLKDANGEIIIRFKWSFLNFPVFRSRTWSEKFDISNKRPTRSITYRRWLPTCLIRHCCWMTMKCITDLCVLSLALHGSVLPTPPSCK